MENELTESNNFISVVELIADDSAFDQPCKFGNRVDSHAVYCHASHWLDAPSKCCRTWYTGGEVKDEDCPAYEMNPDKKITTQITQITNACTKCNGTKTLKENELIRTCLRCVGSGEEPSYIPLTDEEEQVLSTFLFDKETPYVFIASTDKQQIAVTHLLEMHCIQVKSVQCTKHRELVYLLRRYEKGTVILDLHWKNQKSKEKIL